MKKIFFCGDTHGNFDHVIEAVYDHQPDAVVLLGDLQAQQPLEVELSDILDKTDVWFIHGNHDTDSQLDRPQSSRESGHSCRHSYCRAWWRVSR